MDLPPGLLFGLGLLYGRWTSIRQFGWVRVGRACRNWSSTAWSRAAGVWGRSVPPGPAGSPKTQRAGLRAGGSQGQLLLGSSRVKTDCLKRE